MNSRKDFFLENFAVAFNKIDKKKPKKVILAIRAIHVEIAHFLDEFGWILNQIIYWRYD